MAESHNQTDVRYIRRHPNTTDFRYCGSVSHVLF
jgi:hypothetical protein